MSDSLDDFYPGLVVDWPDEYWEITGDDEDPTSRLSLRPMLNMCGVSMHVEAHAVEVVGGVQEGSHPWGQSALDGMGTIYDGDGPFETKTINGRDYVIVAFPHC
jgi:hypothetical protein